jgi:hypothetical protein
MSTIELSKYDSFIDPDCVKLIRGELWGLVFMLVGMWILVPAVFESEKWQISYFNINISLYYLYPVLIGFFCILYLINNVLKFYRYTVLSFNFKDDSIVLNICWFISINIKEFEVVADEYRIRHWNGFRKEYFHCIGLKTNKKVYLIPVVANKKDELVQLLLNHDKIFIKNSVN